MVSELKFCLEEGFGGELTLCLVGQTRKLKGGKPERTAQFSGELGCYPVDGKYKYKELIGSQLMANQRKSLISLSVHQNRLFGIFCAHPELNSKRASWKSGSYDNVSSWIEDQFAKKENWQIYTLKADSETGKFYVLMLKGYGSNQKVVRIDSLDDFEFDGHKITSCTSFDSKCYLVLTKGVVVNSGYQSVITRAEWTAIEKEIAEEIKNGKVIRRVCYNKGKGEYMVVMIEMERRQEYRSFEANDIIS